MKSCVINVFLSILALQGCNYVEVLYREDETIEIEAWIGDFNTITVNEEIALVLEQTNDQIAVISGLDYKVNNLKLTIEDQELLIEPREPTYNRKDQIITLYLPVKNLQRITLNRPTLLSSANELLLDNFALVVNGPRVYSESDLKLRGKSITIAAFGKNSGHHILEGSTDDLRLTMEGLAWTDASQLIATNVTVTQRSLKSSFVHAADELTVNMYSSGNVYYSGNPILHFKTVDPDWQVNFGSAISRSD
jgi:hypothetical protein